MTERSLPQRSESVSRSTGDSKSNSQVSLKLSIERVSEYECSKRFSLGIFHSQIATSLTEITKEVHPLVEQANNLASAVEKQNQFLETWLDFLKVGSTKLASPTENKD